MTTRPFAKGSFVVEYAGDLVDLGVAKQREKNYSMNQHVGCYMYYFQHKTKNYWYRTAIHSLLLTVFINDRPKKTALSQKLSHRPIPQNSAAARLRFNELFNDHFLA